MSLLLVGLMVLTIAANWSIVTFYLHGKPGIIYLLGALIANCLLVNLLTFREIDALVFKRIALLRQSVDRLGKEGDSSARISIPGHDELSALAEGMNGMLDDLEASQIELSKSEAMRRSEQHYRDLVEVCPDAVLILCGSKCVYANAAAARLLHFESAEQLIDVDISTLLRPEYLARLGSQIRKIIDAGEPSIRFESRMSRADGSLADVEIAGIMFDYECKPALQLVVRDMTDNKDYQRQLDHLAHHDHLTGLPNRLLFSDRLSQRLADSRRYNHMTAVLFIDLDRFKAVNDTMGHKLGDILLKEIAGRLSNSLRDVDTVARMGGDEFTVILSNVASLEEVALVAQRTLESISELLAIGDREIYLTASIGVSLYPNDGLDAETLVRNADAAMYKAKECGGNNYQMYTQELNALIMEKMKLEMDLRKALERNEFMLYYQPRVNMQTGQVLGMEALVRWKHPELGVILPGRFIPIAEETGLIVPMSEWIIRTACTQNKAWQDAGLPPISVAVNVSARHFHNHEDLVGTVKEALEISGLDPTYLEIEITEGIVMQDSDLAAKILMELRTLGVKCSVDDFGIGYSSLTYLKTLPLNIIKIDRSFVQEIANNSDDAAIAQAIVSMAHSMNLRVIAEGIETLDQLELLKKLSCDEMQGYFISHAVPPDEFAQFLSNTRLSREDSEWAA
jgi:diguanylate cyclase (GGDEF)-like protein/PAS domain S-box-containing protein